MVGSTSPGTLEPDSSEGQQYHKLGDLVIQGFRNLASKYDIKIGESSQTMPPGEAPLMSIELISTKKAQLTRLQTELLPRLQQLSNQLSDLLNPTELENQPGPRLSLLLEAQAEVERTLDEVQSARAIISREPCFSDEPSDRHLEELKSYRLLLLDRCIVSDLLWAIHRTFTYSFRLSQRLLSSETDQDPTGGDIASASSSESSQEPNDIASTRACVVKYTSRIGRSILIIIGLITGSDFYVIQYDWDMNISMIDVHVRTCMMLVKEFEDIMIPCPAQIEVDPLVSLAKSVLPVLKLSRLYFNKLSGREIRKERMPPFSDLSSCQLAELGDSCRHFVDQIEQLHHILDITSIDEDEETTSERLRLLTEEIKEIVNHSFTIAGRFIISIADKSCFHVLGPWFATWKSLFPVAVQNFMDAIDLYENLPSCGCPKCLEEHARHHVVDYES